MSDLLSWEGIVLENCFHCLAKEEEVVNTIQEFLSSAKLPGAMENILLTICTLMCKLFLNSAWSFNEQSNRTPRCS